MRNAILIGLALGAALALAQDRTVVVPEAGVVWTKSEITPNPVDGGCFFLAYGSNDAGVAVSPGAYDFGGPRCVVIRSASTNAIKKDLGVGNGAVP